MATHSEKHSYTEASPHASGSEISQQGQGDANRETNQVVENKVHYRSNLLPSRTSNDTSKGALHMKITTKLEW